MFTIGLILLLMPLGSFAEVRVTDDLGVEVVLAQPANRIVSLAPHLTEMLFSLGVGNKVLGTARYSNYPAAAKEIPRIGDAFSVNVEALVGLQPDIVFAWQTGGANKSIKKLRDLGIPVYVNESATLASIADSLIRIGKLSGSDKGEQLADEFLQRLKTLKQHYKNPPRVFFQISDQSLYTVSDKHLIGQAIQHCGGTNLFTGLSPSVSMVSEEAVVAGEPDIIFMTQVPGSPHSHWFARWQKFSGFKSRIHLIDPNLVSQPGFRFLAGIAEICEVVDSVAEASDRQEVTLRKE